MATVMLSQRLNSEITLKATEPFTKIATEEVQKISNDPQLHHLFRLAVSDVDQTLRAEQLHALNPKWTANNALNLRVKHGDYNFVLSPLDSPFPYGPYESKTVDTAVHPVIFDYMENMLIPYKRAEKDRQEIELMLTSVFENCKSLQQLLQVIPAAINWIEDPEVLARYRRVDEKRVKVKRDPEAIRNAALSPEAKQALARARINK